MIDVGSPLGQGREFDAIRSLLERWGPVARGIGDDAAVIDLPRGERIVTSVDATVEGIHFRREWIDPREIGYRAATAALSDLAAMAARPLGLLFAVNLPKSWESCLDEIGDGVGDAARTVDTLVLGGNISSGHELSITIAVLGHVWKPLRRAGAVPGDRLYVTGALGGPGAALRSWLADRQPDPAHRSRFARPIARIAEARAIAAAGAHACIDVSDGLASDLGHLCAASGVGADIDITRVPCVAGVSADEAIRSGEEYELLFAAPVLDARRLAEGLGCAITEVGHVLPEDRGVTTAGRAVVGGAGHNHLS